MTILATKTVAFNFVADGTSTVATFDLSQPPIEFLVFPGRPASGLVGVTAVTNTQAVTVPTVTPSIAGSILTLSFATPPPALDGSSNPVIYTVVTTLKF